MTARTQAAPLPKPADGPRSETRRSYAGLPGVGELALAWAGLAVVGVLAFAPHILNGGFYLDDWANGAGALHPPGGPGFGNALSYFAKLTLYRPVLVMYVPLTYFVFGTHMAYHLAWASVLAILVACLLYGLLRTLRVPRVHAWLIAALTLLYPWYDSTRFWATADQATLSIAFAAGGLWIAVAGVRWRSPRLHAGAAALYLLSILTYEITLPLVAMAGVLYAAIGGWRAVRLRWLADLLVVLVGGLWVGLQTTRESRSVAADLQHLKEIVTGGGTILGRTLIAVGQPRTALALIALSLITFTGVAAHLIDRRRGMHMHGWNLRSWLVMTSAGLAVAALGWIMFIPANPYYTPVVYGLTNRVNALAGFGLIIVVYGVLGIGGALVGRLWQGSTMFATALTLVVGLLLGVMYAGVLEHHSDIWNKAFRAEMAGIGVMRTQFPRPARGSTIFTSDYPAYQTLGVPIFSTTWDVNGMIKLQYKDETLSAYPVVPGLAVACLPAGVTLKGPGAPSVTATYGRALLLDIPSGRHARPPDEHKCRALAGSYIPGPLYLSTGY